MNLELHVTQHDLLNALWQYFHAEPPDGFLVDDIELTGGELVIRLVPTWKGGDGGTDLVRRGWRPTLDKPEPPGRR